MKEAITALFWDTIADNYMLKATRIPIALQPRTCRQLAQVETFIFTAATMKITTRKSPRQRGKTMRKDGGDVVNNVHAGGMNINKVKTSADLKRHSFHSKKNPNNNKFSYQSATASESETSSTTQWIYRFEGTPVGGDNVNCFYGNDGYSN